MDLAFTALADESAGADTPSGFITDVEQMKKAFLIALALVAGGAGIALRTERDVLPPKPPVREQPKLPLPQPDEAPPPVEAAVEPVARPEPMPPPPEKGYVSPGWRQNPLMAFAWQNRGALAPHDALETLFWAKEGADVKALVSLIDLSVFTESDLQEAANCFAGIRQDRRVALGIATVEEFIALAWAVSGKARFNGAFFVKARSTGNDDVELRVQLFGTSDTLGFASFAGNHPFVFHRTLEGWQWRMQPHQIAATKDSWTMMTGTLPLARTFKRPTR